LALFELVITEETFMTKTSRLVNTIFGADSAAPEMNDTMAAV